MVNNREQAFQQWLAKQLPQGQYRIENLNGDAGFRQYSRVYYLEHTLHEKSYIAVNAPPDKSNNQAFVTIADVLSAKGIIVPQVIDSDLKQGFFILSDLGNTLLSDVLTLDNMTSYYQKAIDQLVNLLSINEKQITGYQLPYYDRVFIQTELNIFTHWLLGEYLNIELNFDEQKQLQACFDLCVNNAITQPYVFMHRDFHCRNLMVSEDDKISVIDFQDAVKGPVTYDIVSLLRDCYQRWPQAKITPLLDYFIDKVSAQLPKQYSLSQWTLWFDLMGIQRHLKASGIFARLHLRDNKSGYLKDIPLTLSYLVDMTKQYPELTFLHWLISEKVLPALKAKICEQ